MKYHEFVETCRVAAADYDNALRIFVEDPGCPEDYLYFRLEVEKMHRRLNKAQEALTEFLDNQ